MRFDKFIYEINPNSLLSTDQACFCHSLYWNILNNPEKYIRDLTPALFFPF